MVKVKGLRKLRYQTSRQYFWLNVFGGREHVSSSVLRFKLSCKDVSRRKAIIQSYRIHLSWDRFCKTSNCTLRRLKIIFNIGKY